MPIYEYECHQCGEHTEQMQKVNDSPLTKCPACGKDGLHRLISAAGFQLKGSGWYVTDFRSKNKTKPTSEAASEVSKKPEKPEKTEKPKE